MGKAVSSGNSVQHGMLSRHLILPGDKQDEFNALLLQVMTEQQPVGTLKQVLIERIAIAMWRQRRLVAAETAQLQKQQMNVAHLKRFRIKCIICPKSERPMDVDLFELTAELAACAEWLRDRSIYKDAHKNLPGLTLLKIVIPLSEMQELKHDTTEEAAARISRDKAIEHLLLSEAVRTLSLNCLEMNTAQQQVRQAVLHEREFEVLSPLLVQSGQRRLQGHARFARATALPTGLSGDDGQAHRACGVPAMSRTKTRFLPNEPYSNRIFSMMPADQPLRRAKESA